MQTWTTYPGLSGIGIYTPSTSTVGGVSSTTPSIRWEQMVYPNPCVGLITIEHEKLQHWQGNVDVLAIDLQGRKIPLSNGRCNQANQVHIDLTNMAAGQYMILLLHNGEQIQTPWISVVH